MLMPRVSTQEEDRIIEREVSLLKQRLAEQNIPAVFFLLLSLIHTHNLASLNISIVP